MKKKIFAFILPAFCALFALLLNSACLYADTAEVLSVIDGDTIKVRTNNAEELTVRYLMIDTPETAHPARGVEDFGEEAKKANIELVSGKEVRLEYDKELTDRYGRKLAHVWITVKDKEFLVGEILALNGLALKMQLGVNKKYEERIDKAVSLAKENKRGLWNSIDKIYPLTTLWANASVLKGKWFTVKLTADEIKIKNEIIYISQKSTPIRITIYKSAHNSALKQAKAGDEIIIFGNLSQDKSGWYIRIGDPRQIIKP